MNEMKPIHDGSTDIDPVWAGDGADIPEWFAWALSVPREEGFVEVGGARVHYLRWGRRDRPKLLMTFTVFSPMPAALPSSHRTLPKTTTWWRSIWPVWAIARCAAWPI